MIEIEEFDWAVDELWLASDGDACKDIDEKEACPKFCGKFADADHHPSFGFFLIFLPLFLFVFHLSIPVQRLKYPGMRIASTNYHSRIIMKKMKTWWTICVVVDGTSMYLNPSFQ